MPIDDDRYKNIRKLVGDERFKKLYHYTSFDSFVKIWLSQSLKFAPLSNVNDILEIDFKTGVINSDRLDLCIKLNDYRLSFKQISFTMDYDSALKGCMSPMMWGLYADKRKGVCPFSALLCGVDIVYCLLLFFFHYSTLSVIIYRNVLKDVVSYKNFVKWQNIVDNGIETEKGFAAYVKKHQKRLFFTKQKSWIGENEYRVLSREDYLDISKAITAVYLTSCWSQECEFVEKLVCDKVPVKFLTYIGTYNNWAIPVLKDTKEQREYEEYMQKKLQSDSQ